MEDGRAASDLTKNAATRPEVEAWCARVRSKLGGVLEIGIVRIEASHAVPVGLSPADMPLSRPGYLEGIARARGTKSAILMPLDRPEDGVSEVIAIPLATAQGEAVLVAGIAELPSQKIELAMEYLQEASGWIVYDLSRAQIEEAERLVSAQGTAFTITAELLDARSAGEANQTLVSLVAEPLNASRAVLIRKRIFGRAKMVAVSGQARFDRRQRLNDLTEQVGHEALMRREALVWRRGDGANTVLATLAEAHGDAALAAIPLGDAAGKMRDVVVLHWQSADDVPELDLWIPLWVLSRPVIALQERAGRGPFKRAGAAIYDGLGKLLGPRALKTKLLVIALAAATAAAIFVDVPNTLPAETSIDDPDLRVLASPADGYLASVSALPGDTVLAGQEVARLDTSDLRLNEAELEAQLARHLAQEALSRQNRDLGAAAVAQAEANETRARLEKIRTEIDRSVIRAQADGQVLEGDLRQRIGSQVSYGEALMQVAPRLGVEVKLSVKNRDGGALEQGLTGTLRLRAAPEIALPLVVQRVKPGAEIIDGEARFVAFATVEAGDLRLENGMRGIARLDLGQAKIWEVWLKPAAETAYLFLWRWMP